MSITISVAPLAEFKRLDKEGYQFYKQKFAKINQILQRNHLPTHQESEIYPPIQKRFTLNNISNSWLNYLRWAYMQINNDPNITLSPVEKGKNPIALMGDDVIDFMGSHLMNYCDSQGVYLPIDFYEPIADDEVGIISSSVGLLKELKAVAPYLGINLENEELSESELHRIEKFIHSQTGLYREFASWLLLFENAKNSVKYGTAMLLQ